MRRRVLSITPETFPIAGTFTISRGSKTEAEVLTCRISYGDHAGWGECVPYKRYGESIDSVAVQIEGVAEAVANDLDRQGLMTLLPAGAARNAVDCALWDLEAKLNGRTVAASLGITSRPWVDNAGRPRWFVVPEPGTDASIHLPDLVVVAAGQKRARTCAASGP